MSDIKNHKRSTTVYICFTALFAALCCLGTMISVPLPFGYFNLGDIFVLTGSFILGPIYGALAAGIGSALADLFAGYAIYMPATFIIKALVGASGFFLFELFKRIIKAKWAQFFIILFSSLLAECIMVGGYFLYESLVLGYGLGAAASILGNCLQGVCGALGATFIFSALRSTKALNNILEKINRKKQ